MKKIGFGFVVALTLASAGAAQAEDRRSHRVFDDAGLGSADSAALAETAAVEKACSFNVMSRRGPDPEDVAACEAAASRLMKRGVAAAPAMFASLDKENVSYHVKQRLYDMLARTHDTRIIEPLIRGMARISSRKLETRDWETGMIDRALGELSRAPVGESAPWVQRARRSDHQESIGQIIDWRLWHEQHRGVSHDKLAAERLADARAHAGDADAARAYGAVLYLLKQEPKEGLAAAKALLERADLPEEGKQSIEYPMTEATEALQAIAAPPPAPAAPAAKSAPPKPTPRPKQAAPKKQGRVGS